MDINKTFSIRVIAPHYVAGIVCWENGTIMYSAPILNWCKGRGLKSTIDYLKRKGYLVEKIEINSINRTFKITQL